MTMLVWDVVFTISHLLRLAWNMARAKKGAKKSGGETLGAGVDTQCIKQFEFECCLENPLWLSFRVTWLKNG